MFEIRFVEPAAKQYHELKHKPDKKGVFKQVAKTISLLAHNPRHPSLNTHEFNSLANPYDPKQKVFLAYAQNNTSAAYRVFWCYGPTRESLTILAVTPHP